MEVERITTEDGQVELWAFEWDTSSGESTKINRQFLGLEQPAASTKEQQQRQHQHREAICWSYGRTLGNIAVFNSDVLGTFPSQHGDDAILACDIVEAGKMRNGAGRWWCRTHQMHWGTRGDIAAARDAQTLRCSGYMQRMSYAVDPPVFRIDDQAELGIWCSLPPAITSAGDPAHRHPRIHVHVRNEPGGKKVVDQDVPALSLHYNAKRDLFANTQITRVHVTPPAAFDFVMGLEMGTEMGCIDCKTCGYPHLDLGHFGRVPHTKHLCGNCGRDTTWSKGAIVSTPLKPLHDQYSAANNFADVTSTLNLDDYPDHAFALWASTPAVLWTAHRPQERGIHVHLGKDGVRIIDDTFGTVIYRGEALDRRALLDQMIARTIL